MAYSTLPRGVVPTYAVVYALYPQRIGEIAIYINNYDGQQESPYSVMLTILYNLAEGN